RPPPPMRPEPPARASSLWRYASTIDAGGPSLMIRDIMYRKPGKVRPMVEKFVAMAKLGEKNGMGRMRAYTDVSAEQYWTVVSEIEVESLERFMSMGPEAGAGTGARPVPATTGVAVPCARRSASRAKRG